MKPNPACQDKHTDRLTLGSLKSQRPMKSITRIFSKSLVIFYTLLCVHSSLAQSEKDMLEETTVSTQVLANYLQEATLIQMRREWFGKEKMQWPDSCKSWMGSLRVNARLFDQQFPDGECLNYDLNIDNRNPDESNVAMRAYRLTNIPQDPTSNYFFVIARRRNYGQLINIVYRTDPTDPSKESAILVDPKAGIYGVLYRSNSLETGPIMTYGASFLQTAISSWKSIAIVAGHCDLPSTHENRMLLGGVLNIMTRDPLGAIHWQATTKEGQNYVRSQQGGKRKS